jgi:hypothetical protein
MDSDTNYPDVVLPTAPSFDPPDFDMLGSHESSFLPNPISSQASIYSQASMSSQSSNVSTGKFIGSIEEINAAQRVEVNDLLNVISKLLSLNNLIKFLRPEQVAAFTENKEELTQKMMALASKDYVWLEPYPPWFVNGIKSNIKYEDFTKFKESLTFECVYQIDDTIDMSDIVNDLEKLVRDSLSNSIEFMKVYDIELPSQDLPIDEFDAFIKNKLVNYPFFNTVLGHTAIMELADNNTHILPAMINRLLIISGEVVDLGVPFNANRFGLLHNSRISYFFKMIIELNLIVELTTDGKSDKRKDRLAFLVNCAQSKARIALYDEMCEYMWPHTIPFMFVSLSGGNLITIFAKLLKALQDLVTSLENTSDGISIDVKIQQFMTKYEHYYAIFTRFTMRHPELFETAEKEDNKRKTKKQKTRESPIITPESPIITPEALLIIITPESLLIIINKLIDGLENLDTNANKSFSDIDIKWCCLDPDEDVKSYTPSNIESIPLGVEQCEAYYETFKEVAKDAGQYTTFFLVREKTYQKKIVNDKNISPELEKKFADSLGNYFKILKRNCIKCMKTPQYTHIFTSEDIKMIENMLTSQMYEERLERFKRDAVKDIPGISNCIKYLQFLLLKKKSNDEATKQNIELLRDKDDNKFIDKLKACATAGNKCIFKHFYPAQDEKIKQQPLRFHSLNKEYYRYFATLDSMVISKKGAIPKLASEILLEMINAINIHTLFEREDIMSLPFKVEGSYSDTDTWKQAHTNIIKECEEQFRSTFIAHGLRAILLALDDKTHDDKKHKKHSASSTLKLSQSMLKIMQPKLPGAIAKKSKLNWYDLERWIPDNILRPTIDYEALYEALEFEDEGEIFTRITTESPGNPIKTIGNPTSTQDGGNKTMKSKKHKTKKSKKSRKHKSKKPKKSRKSKPQKSRKHKSKKPKKSRKYKPQKSRKLRY